MSPLEEIEKLKEECAEVEAKLGTSGFDQFIDRAASLGGKFVRDRVEIASNQQGEAPCLHMPKCVVKDASQALSELEKKV